MWVIFVICAGLLVLSSVAVVMAHDPIHSALWLVLDMCLVAAMFAMLDAHFLAVVQVIVYAGAIMVLVLFVLMLLNIELEKRRRLGGFSAICAVALGLTLLLTLLPRLNATFADLPVSQSEVIGDARQIGLLLFSKYVFPFEAASMLIIAAMVGAVLLAKKDQKR